MKVVNGALVRGQNFNDCDDSAFDTSECLHMLQKLESPKAQTLKLGQFIVNNVLQRHPQTKFPNDISSDQAHMYALPTNMVTPSLIDFMEWWPRTTNGRRVSIGFFAYIEREEWLSNLALIAQIIFFWFPVRWNDDSDPATPRIQFGYRHHCGDYRLFKQCLYYAPWWIKRLVSKKTLKKMTRYYWYGPDYPETQKEPNIDWLISIDDKFIEECL